MTSYEIKPYTHLMAYKHGVKAVPSKNPNKKIDLLDFNGSFICSIGDIKKCDYPTNFKTRGAAFAERMRDEYHLRHKNHKEEFGTKSHYSSRLLW